MPGDEGTRKSGEFLAVCLTPDICKTPVGTSVVPVPYQVVARMSDSNGISQNVNFGGAPAFLLNSSKITKVVGDEPGTAGGVKSGTYRAAVEPISGSSTVFANGRQVVRHGDQCKMNNGNTLGKFLYQGGGANRGGNCNPPVRAETSKEVDAARKKKGIWSRFSGTIHTALDIAGFIPGLGAIPDLANAGIYALEGDTALAALSVVAAVPGMGDGIKAGKILAKGGKQLLKKTENKAATEISEATAKDATEKASRSIAKDPPRRKKPADGSGNNGGGNRRKDGVRVKRSTSLREQYMGHMPGKNSKTGREVIERMRGERKIRENPITLELEFKSSKGEWYNIKEADMSHKKAAVTWWNETGRQYGARSREVREWMLDPENYFLDHRKYNRSAGPKIGQTYQSPLQ